MTMEKTGEIKPDKTPDTEDRLTSDEKRAGAKTQHQQSRELDDDATKRLAEAAE